MDGDIDKMDGDIDENAVLDRATFHLSSSQDRFEVIIYSDGRSERVSSGCLDELRLFIPATEEVKELDSDSFNLQPTEGMAGSSWFRKSTLKIFLNIASDVKGFKKVTAIQNELDQLEDTRNFHVALYNKDKQVHVGDSAADVGCLKEVESIQRVKVETVSSDATKNELLRALDVRLTALKEELVEKIDCLLCIRCSKGDISDLVAFVCHFGNDDLRKVLLKYLSLKFEDANDYHEKSEPTDSLVLFGNMQEEKPLFASKATTVSAVGHAISPAEIAKAERKSPTESDESLNSSDEDQISAERSRPIIRSASPRRSASPMRRVQIGRSGSRRAAAVTIKSLNYFPARDKTCLNKEIRDGDEEDESFDQPPKKTETELMRMSVQDRINLFERKQRDQTLDIQRTSGTDSHLGSTKHALRRWSSGTRDSSAICPHETSCNIKCESSPNDPIIFAQNDSANKESDIQMVCSKSGVGDVTLPLESKAMPASSATESRDSVVSQIEEVSNRATISSDWTRQKEVELNQLMEMIEHKTGKFVTAGSKSARDLVLCAEQKKDFHNQYKEKRDEKLRISNVGRRTEEAKLKAMHQDVIDQKNVEMAKKVGTSGKLNPSVQPLKSRRNSSPPVLSNKSNSNVASKKSPKTTAPPTLAKRNSLPLTPSPKATGTVLSKTSSKTAAGTPNRRKPHSTASPVLSGSLTERFSRQPREFKSLSTEAKVNSKTNEEKKLKAMTKSTKLLKEKSAMSSLDDSAHLPAKTSFYNKVTRKSSVVPLEPKPFLKKGSGIGSGSGIGNTKPKSSQSDDISKISEDPLVEMKNSINETPEEVTQPSVVVPVKQDVESGASVDHSGDDEINNNEGETNDLHFVESYDDVIQLTDSPHVASHGEEDMGISAAAWVDSDHQSMHDFSLNTQTQTSMTHDNVPVLLSSPRIRHSLSQMLQADSTDSEIIEWGNAENPPALVFQKDAPKGFKRLLKFARKSKGDSNVTGWSSPSVFSDGEEDADESKNMKKSSDALSRKAALKSKNAGKTRNLLRESFDSGNSSKRLIDHSAARDMLSASISSLPLGIHKIQDGSDSSVSNSNKGSRSFFSLSTFRSNKSSDTKLR